MNHLTPRVLVLQHYPQIDLENTAEVASSLVDYSSSMSCIHCYSPPLHLLALQKHSQNANRPTNLCCLFSGYSSTRRHCNVTSKVGVFPINDVEDFSTSLTLAVAKPADTQVLIQTSALLICFYLVANFVVPQYITKNFGLNKVDENEKSNNTESEDEGKSSSSTKKLKRGFNSTKPK